MMQLVRDQMDTPDTTTPVVTGAIDWVAVKRAFDEEFDLNSALEEAAGDVSSGDAIDDLRLDGYGGNYQVVVDLDTRSIANEMEDSVGYAIEAWFDSKARSAGQDI